MEGTVSNEMSVAIRKQNLHEFVKKSRMSDTIESFPDIKENSDSLFSRLTGLGNGLHYT